MCGGCDDKGVAMSGAVGVSKERKVDHVACGELDRGDIGRCQSVESQCSKDAAPAVTRRFIQHSQ